MAEGSWRYDALRRRVLQADGKHAFKVILSPDSAHSAYRPHGGGELMAGWGHGRGNLKANVTGAKEAQIGAKGEFCMDAVGCSEMQG